MDEQVIERMEAEVVEVENLGEYPFNVSIRVSDAKYIVTARAHTITGLDERVELLRGWVKQQPGYTKPPGLAEAVEIAKATHATPPSPPTSEAQIPPKTQESGVLPPSEGPAEWTVDAEVQSFVPLMTDGGKLRPKVKCKAGEGMIWTQHGVTAWPDDFWGAAGIDINACTIGETYTFPTNVVGAVVLCKKKINDAGQHVGTTPMKIVKFRLAGE